MAFKCHFRAVTGILSDMCLYIVCYKKIGILSIDRRTQTQSNWLGLKNTGEKLQTQMEMKSPTLKNVYSFNNLYFLNLFNAFTIFQVIM